MKHPKYKSASIFVIIPFTFITVTIIAVLIAVFTVLDSPAELVGASIDSVLNHHLNHLLQIAFAALSVVLFFYIYFLHKLRKSFQALIETSEKFIAGDIEQRVTKIRNDEIGYLGSTFNRMAETISVLLNDLESRVEERTKELQTAHQEIADSKNKLELILNSTAEAIYGLDISGKCTFCNASAVSLLGYEDQSEFLGKNIHEMIHHTDIQGNPLSISQCKIYQSIRSGDRANSSDELFWRRDGTSFEVEYRAYPQIMNDEYIGAVVTFRDVTADRQAQRHMAFWSKHDPVTGIYNRVFFEQAIKHLDRTDNLPLAVIFCDVNGLKLLNDIMGHDQGDELLRAVASIMQSESCPNATVCRIGGDEFVALLPETDQETAENVAKQIKSRLAKENFGGIKGSVAIGLAMKDDHSQPLAEVLNKAETRMYKTKTMESKVVNQDMLVSIMESLFAKSARERQHCQNVSRFSKSIAQQLQLSEAAVRRTSEAGYFHDIGKIILSPEILNKSGQLNSDEQHEMNRHPLTGYRVLNLFNDTMHLADAVLAHHERWDGQGYPKGLKGEEIPLTARIISVAEGYDAMTNMVGGGYGSHEAAVKDIAFEAGSKYDPEVAQAFLAIADTFKPSLSVITNK